MDVLAARFEDSRPHLAAVAFRMLGSRAEADDAVQEAWLRLARSDVDGVDNLRGWLTTVVARVCLDMLRSRSSRREEPLTDDERVAPDPGPEGEAVMADSVGAALLLVLDTLAPAERLAFVLHDLFAVPFDEIGAIVGRSPAAARQLASRARRRVQGTGEGSAAEPGATVGEPDAAVARRREVVAAFLAASRGGDFDALLALLDPDAVARADAAAVAAGADAEVRGAPAVAGTFAGRAKAARLVLLDGEPGLVWSHRGEVRMAFAFTVLDDHVADIELIADPARLAAIGVEPLP
jgi:RNA polymerase sigma factor (sigma-70 family)